MTSPYPEHPDKVRYPIGEFGLDAIVTPAKRRRWIRRMDETPRRLAEAVAGLSEAQLRIPYRDGGWTSQQVVHHQADAHLNSFARFKLALTEDTPAIKTYEEALWAEIRDGRHAPAESSLQLLAALHRRWTLLLESLPEADFGCAFSHPDRGLMTLDKAIQLCAWHGLHHTAHVTELRARRGW
jgi:uncharacterized damage-inducible protein DinB